MLFCCCRRLWVGVVCVFVLALIGTAPSTHNCAYIILVGEAPCTVQQLYLSLRIYIFLPMEVLFAFAARSLLLCVLCDGIHTIRGILCFCCISYVYGILLYAHHIDQRSRNARRSRNNTRSLWSEVSRSPLLSLRRLVRQPLLYW